MEFPVYDNMNLVALPQYRKKLGIVDANKIGKLVIEIKDSLKIKCENVKKHLVKGLSGGNQQKVVIGKWLMANPEFIIVDEPTRGIDIGAKAEIYQILNDLVSQGKGVLVISSEMEELMGICNRILVMSKGEIVGSFDHSEFNQESILRKAFRQETVEKA